MTELVAAEIVRAIPAALIAIPAILIAWRNLRKTNQVHDLVNGARHALESKLAQATIRIEALERALKESRGRRKY